MIVIFSESCIHDLHLFTIWVCNMQSLLQVCSKVHFSFAHF